MIHLNGTDVARIARVTHEANRLWCLYNGDDSQPTWEESPQWQKESAFAGVRFHAFNPDATGEASHSEWLRHKEAEGWVYGEVKDEEAKTHPCIVAYDDLPKEEKFKDDLFRTIVDAEVRGLGIA